MTEPTSKAYQFEQQNYYPRLITDYPFPKLGTPPEGDLYSTPFAEKVLAVTDSIAELLVTKNAAYGNSALDPIRIFSDADTDAGLDVRIDDKLSRIARGHEYQSDDTLTDLIGYLVLKLVGRMEE